MTKEEFLHLNADDVFMIDIREATEVQQIPSPKGSTHIPMQICIQQIISETLPKDKKIITICHSGGRCQLLQEHLHAHGYESDFLEGGVAVL